MSYRLEIQLEALIDIKAAYDWYESKRIGLGDELIAEIEDCYSSISDYPDRYGFVKGSMYFRRVKVSRFPYIIVFEVSGEDIFVNSIVHIKQDRSFE